MRVMLVGDVHAKADELADCVALRNLILKTCSEEGVRHVVWLGDQHHSHVLVNIEVQKFWLETFELVDEAIDGWQVILDGNHDKPADSTSQASANQVYVSSGVIVDKPRVIALPDNVGDEKVLFAPYMHNQDELLAAAKEYSECKLLVCHQTFQGAEYDNGFYAQGAIDPNLFPQEQIISGHIHTSAKFGKVLYPGSPRWLTRSDANSEHGIYIMDLKDGRMEVVDAVDTSSACRVIRTLKLGVDSDYAELAAKVQSYKPEDLVEVVLEGALDWIQDRKRALSEVRPGLRFDSRVITGRSAKVKESEGIGPAFKKHLAGFKPKFGTSLEVLEQRAARVFGATA